ncbi:kinesin family member 11 [Pseudoscourfieldia marina]
MPASRPASAPAQRRSKATADNNNNNNKHAENNDGAAHSSSAPATKDGVNVQVVLRCRPTSKDETARKLPQVVHCTEQTREVKLVQTLGGKQMERTFTFDRVFGPNSRQQDVYDVAISPLVKEVLDGYNCTVFAYGQTGTGKTYTMEGEKLEHGVLTSGSGVIPRAVSMIFNELESAEAEYSVKVSFMELYNEEITDLLAPEVDILAAKPKVVDHTRSLALMEDKSGSVQVRGIEERIVKTESEIFAVLTQGSDRRRTAETKLNHQSSRSHSLFTITIHTKESTPEGEELIKCGKLNLVDLAGSENIGRSGAKDARAREAGEINKSLLTLGRVITALVDHHGYVPYRDSKLTRLLRDSLGGRTKTCIIATVSPSNHCYEETQSTLDYAHRAKNIRNRPEVNMKMTKHAHIKDLTGEIERLKVDLIAQREKNGVFISAARYAEEEAARKTMQAHITSMEAQLEGVAAEREGMQEKLRIAEEEKEAQRAEMQARINELSVSLEETRASLESESKLRVEAEAEVRRLEEEKEAQRVQMQGQIDDLSKELSETQATLAKTLANLDEETQARKLAEAEVRRLQQEQDDKRRELDDVRRNLESMVDERRDVLEEMVQKHATEMKAALLAVTGVPLKNSRKSGPGANASPVLRARNGVQMSSPLPLTPKTAETSVCCSPEGQENRQAEAA